MHASVVFIRIQEFTRRPVSEQARLRAQLEAVVAVTISTLVPENRIVLDAQDGAAVVVLGDPKRALEVAERALGASEGLPLCVGVNHGAVKPTTGERGEQGLVGDGIASAATVADFATPSRLLVSRSFREVLAEVGPDREADLRPAGVFTDARVRTHELLTPDRHAARNRRRRFLVIGAVSVVGFLGTGVVLRDIVTKSKKSGPPAVLLFDITPRGEIFIDGEAKGKSPPLTQMRISPGSHTVEVRNSSYPPIKFDVELEPGEQITIKHSFSSGTPGDFFRGLRKKLGF